MEQLTLQFQQLTIETNFVPIGTHTSPSPPRPINDVALERHKKTVLFAIAKHFYTYEVEEVLNMHRPSATDTENIYLDFFQGDVQQHNIIKDDIYYQALNYVTELFTPPQKCRPAHIFDVRYHYDHDLSSNAEAPFSTEPYYRDQAPRYAQEAPGQPKTYSLSNMYNIVFNETRRFHHEIKEGANLSNYLWYIQHHNRFMVTKANQPPKTRTVSGFPRPQNIGWIMFTWSYLNWLKKRDPRTSPMLWSFETNLGGWLRLNYLLHVSFQRSTIITLDKSTFDKFYYFAIQDDIDNMLMSFIDFDNGYLPTIDYPDTQSQWTTTKANRLRRLFRWLTYSFRECPTLFLDGVLYKRRFAGMPSGVYTVQLFDTIYFAITDTDVLLRMGISLSQIRLRKGQGDDILTQLDIYVPPSEHEAFLSQYSSIDHQRFNSTISVDKSEVHNTPRQVEVLGYRNNNGLPVRSSIKLLAQLYHAKSAQLTESISMSIAVGIAYASLGHDQRVYLACKNVYDYYHSFGHTMNQKYLERSYKWTNLDLSNIVEFPTFDDVRSNLFDFSFEPRKNTLSWFPRDHFLSEF